MREKVGKGALYKSVPGTTWDKEFLGQRKTHFLSNLQSQIGSPARRLCLEITAGETLCVGKDPWRPRSKVGDLSQSVSDRDCVRDNSQA